MEPDRNSPQEFQQDSVPSPLPSLRTTTDTEAMGDFHFSSENFSLALEYFEKAYQHTQAEGPRGDLWRLAFKIGDAYRRTARIVSPDIARTYTMERAKRKPQAADDFDDALIEAREDVAALHLLENLQVLFDAEVIACRFQITFPQIVRVA